MTYDLHQVDEANLPSLRDTLIKCVETYHSGPKTIMTQLCLALSGLALQFPDWGNAVQSLVDAFGRIPAMVPALLQFLTLLPEEITMNSRIPVTVRGTAQSHGCTHQSSIRTRSTVQGHKS